jgi:site-specific recombinase XerD
MKHFESFLASQMQEYILYRQGLGYTDKNILSLLLPFDSYLKESQSNWESLRPPLFLALRETLKGDPKAMNGILCAVRGFFQFLLREDLMEENPLRDIPPFPERAYIPFIFSEKEIEELLLAALKNLRRTPKHFLSDQAAYLAIVFMARCGLRISEPLRLLQNHYRPKECTLYIEKTKFKKDRLIPIPKSMTGDIGNYLALRNALLADDNNPYFFCGVRRGSRLSKTALYSLFHQAVKDSNLYQPKRVMATITFGSPTPHSLRHSFAVNTLKRIKERGKSPQNALPILAAYMGHRKYRYTALYLKVLDAQQRKALVDFTMTHQEEV